ncbi:haloacid dehalogenase type II [Acidithrix ferrooxidans]|uniref:(S)-2-haloacid dehalogenase 4A n=1 Tax=Acidithrix ferrooxidans TaxID=1280514 RepID=A0A0D8HGB5_9ACTN|nr:haloacid dehalogenase type II [Acidithrix ferrooxidans]KJF16953.1 (S)-2-haloacid dehalogenase 4A [Acidithrix ferrooxidans]
MSAPAQRPSVVVFDVNETLFDLSALRPNFEAMGLPSYALDWWFAVVLRDGFALAAAGDASAFVSLVEIALDEVFASFGRNPPTDVAAGLLDAFRELPAHADVGPAFRRLVQANIPVVALTNGSASVTAGLIERASLSHLVTHVLSVDSVGYWKPRPEAYHFASREVGVEAGRLAMVAAHPWDLNGASRAGLVTGWVNRTERPWPRAFTQPHVETSTLDGVIDRLLALP